MVVFIVHFSADKIVNGVFFGLLRVWTSSQRCAETGSEMATLLLLHITSLLYLYMCLFSFRIFLLLLQIIFGETG